MTHRAKRNTVCLLLVFPCILLVAAGLIYFVPVSAYRVLCRVVYTDADPGWLHTEYLLWSGGLVLGTILVGSVYHLARLGFRSQGVMKRLGAVKIHPTTQIQEEIVALRCVEEVGKLAQVKPAALYLLPHEIGVNAFAAGLSSSSACIAVTRGCLLSLNEQEFKGVLGHEYSHILEGDLRINLLVMALTSSFNQLELIGVKLRDDPDKNPVVFTFGNLLVAIGRGSALLGKILQCAISRQREYLADAEAVKIVGDTDGLLSVLRRLHLANCDSTIASPHRNSIDHMCFASVGVRNWFERLFGSHPPLEKRIAQLESLGK